MTSKNDPPRRKKSVLRTMVLTAVGGLMGLGLGYYVLLWLRGPEIDFLEAAKYLPKAVLPASFNNTPSKLASAPAPPLSKAEPTPPASTSAEKTADFTEPVDANSHVAEPATFNAPNATPLKEHTAEMPRITGAPTFTEADLTAAIQAGKDAEPGLVNGSLSDGVEVGKKKGFSYSILADLAQKSMFVNAAASANAATLQQEANEVFRNTLATAHAREEVARIAPMWIASGNRRQGGVFFACNIVGQQAKGTMSESSVDLGTGTTLTVLIPSEDETQGAAKGPVAVVGWIINDPAKNVAGYTGNAPQAIVAAKLIPLQ